jgi:hypothetical protein
MSLSGSPNKKRLTVWSSALINKMIYYFCLSTASGNRILEAVKIIVDKKAVRFHIG